MRRRYILLITAFIGLIFLVWTYYITGFDRQAMHIMFVFSLTSFAPIILIALVCLIFWLIGKYFFDD